MIILAPGEWSEPLYDTFPTRTGSTEGLFYFKLHELSPDAGTVTLVRSDINCAHNYTFPASIAEELNERGIPYMENLENAVTVMRHDFDFEKHDGNDLDLLVEAHNMQVHSLANIADYLLHKYPWDITYIQVHIPDGFNHTLGAYLHPDARNYTPQANIDRAYELFKGAYKSMDTLLGRIWDECKGKDDVLAVVSDHGSMGAWKWIIGMGMLVGGGFTVFDKVPSPTYGFRYRVNMQKSKVFRGVLSEHLFINLRAKFPSGIVEPEDYDTVRDELIAYLKNVKDPETGQCPFYKILKKEDAGYLGLSGDYIGDVLTYVKPGYYDGLHMANFFIQDYWDYIAGDDLIIQKHGATHTPYHPDCHLGIMGSNAFFFITGPGIKKNFRKKESIHLVDVVPTLAHLAGIDRPKNADGRIVEEFLAEE
jgi:predicted AlkP superfamily phosphohydrolase/phosphomutase